MLIKDIKIGASGTVEGVVLGLEEKETKSGSSYVNIQFSDGDQTITIKNWNATLQTVPFEKGNVIFVTMKVEEYEGNPSYIAKDMTLSSSAPDAFIPSAPISAENMYAFLYKYAEKCGEYAPVVTQILNDYKSKLLIWSAAKEVHHNVRGGLLYHMYRMTKCAAYIANVYNKSSSIFTGGRVVNLELLVAGTILHDIGKIWELDTDAVGSAEYTVKGSLMGHLYLGAEIVGKYAAKCGLKEEKAILLQHLILSHHGKYEYHTVALPATPEAMILHQLDMIDSRIYQYEAVNNTLEPGELSGFVPSLGMRVYRPLEE